MQFGKLVNNRLVTVLAGATVVALIGAGAGYSAAQITSADIANNTVRSKDVKDGDLKVKDLRKGAVKKLKGQAGPQGPQGPQGPAGNGNKTVATAPVVASGTAYTAGSFRLSNATVGLTPDGVEFGPYANGGAAGGSVCTNLLNGQKLSAVKSLNFYQRYVASNDSGGVGVPYMRIFLKDASNTDTDMIFSPNTQTPDPDIAEGPFHEWIGTQGSWRYEDDLGSGPDSPFSTLQTAHANDTITELCISMGFTNGNDLAGLLRWWEINGTTYVFKN